MPVTFCDQGEAGFGWIAAEPRWMARCSHALLADGGVWLVDPVDVPGLDGRLAALGEPRGVLQLFARHRRDSAALSARLGVPHLVVPLAAVAGAPFEVVPLPARGRPQESALWWPERGTLIVAEALGSAPHYCAPGRPLGLHPVRRLLRPPRLLLRFEPQEILFGHGPGVHEEASGALRLAFAERWRGLPGAARRVARARRDGAG